MVRLSQKAEELQVDLFPGFGGDEVLYSDDSKKQVIGVATNDMGVDKLGNPKETFQRGKC